ncbi:MAG TPA: hypothetical protein ENH94_06265 [Phycisphaerales bacterium]|nr:hypothetical protein [Phycisphaerales bacterium]
MTKKELRILRIATAPIWVIPWLFLVIGVTFIWFFGSIIGQLLMQTIIFCYTGKWEWSWDGDMVIEVLTMEAFR